MSYQSRARWARTRLSAAIFAAVALAGCGSGSESTNGNDDVVDASSADIELSPDAAYSMRTRPVSAAGVGPWSEPVTMLTYLDNVPTSTTDASAVVFPGQQSEVQLRVAERRASVDETSSDVTWAAQPGADAWEIVVETLVTGERVAHRMVAGEALCGSDGVCRLEPSTGRHGESGTSRAAVTASVNPMRGGAPLDVEFVAEGEVASVDWLIGGSSFDAPATTRWSHVFEQPGTHEITMLAVDARGVEVLELITIEVEGGAGLAVAADSQFLQPVLMTGAGEPQIVTAVASMPAPAGVAPESALTAAQVEPSIGAAQVAESANAPSTAIGMPAPATKPVASVAPVPATKPVASVAPAPATKPVASVEPAPATEPVASVEPEQELAAAEQRPEPAAAPVEVDSTDTTSAAAEPAVEPASSGAMQITVIETNEIGARSATITWSLDRVATGQVEYGESVGYGSWSTSDESFDWDHHRQTIDGLEPDTLYHFRVHSTDRSGQAAVSADRTFTTDAESAPVVAAATPTDIAPASGWPAGTNGELPMSGVFYGNPSAGVGVANASIAVISSRRFRAERGGDVSSVRYHNRTLMQSNITGRCASYGEDSEWCRCERAGLDAYSCGYTLGSSYSVGNGGLITIEVRPDDGNGLPSEQVIARSESFVPMDLPANTYPSIAMQTPARLSEGAIYHLVFTNARPPIKCALGRVDPSKAADCERDRGAIGLNGVWHAHGSKTTGQLGPWYGDDAGANLYKRNAGDSWKRYEYNLSYFELGYTDGVNVGDSYSAWNVTKGTAQRTIGGSTRARQRFTVQDASRRVDGLWLNFGHSGSANGSALSVTLKDQGGTSLASGSLPPSSECRAKAANPVKTMDGRCRDWNYATFDKTVTLIEGESYSVEFNGPSGSGFIVSTYEPLSIFHPFDDRNAWQDSRAEVSTDGGKGWGQWTSRLPGERDMALLFTIEGMPRQLR